MGEVVDVLYGSNLGCDVVDDVFDMASHLLKFEQKFLDWQRFLPASLRLIEPDNLRTETCPQELLRFRFVITVRFLNLRILTHRPILSKYLEILSKSKPDPQQLNMVRQVSANSIRICVHSALEIIRVMREALMPPDPPRHLLGAWWFALYYSKSLDL